jgi:hypothetical protein
MKMKKLIAVLLCLGASFLVWSEDVKPKGNVAASAVPSSGRSPIEALFNPSFKGWQAVGGDAVSTAVVDGKTACQFSGDLSKVDERISWDVNGTFDLSNKQTIKLSLWIQDQSPISILTFYFCTKGGLYKLNLPAASLNSGWNTVDIVPKNLETERTPTGLNAITSIRISAWKKTDGTIKFSIMPAGILPGKQAPDKIIDAQNPSSPVKAPSEKAGASPKGNVAASAVPSSGQSPVEALFNPSFKGWQTVGGNAVSTAVVDGKTACQFSGDLAKVKERISWDVNGAFNLSNKQIVKLSLWIQDPSPISLLTFYFFTKSGLYKFNLPAAGLNSGWNTVDIVPENLETEGKPSGLDAITLIRLSAWKKTDEPATFYIMPAGVLPEKQAPDKTIDALNSSSPVIAPSENELISNPSAENVKNGVPVGYWWNGTAAKVEAKAKVKVVNDAHTGENAIAVIRLNDVGEYSIHPPFKKIEPSASPRYYTASVWMKSETAQGVLRVYIQCANSKWSKDYFEGGDAATESGSWSRCRRRAARTGRR